MSPPLRARVRSQPDCAHWANVLLGLGEGDLRPLAAHIRSTSGHMDPCVAKRLLALIETSTCKPPFVLRIVPRGRKVNSVATPHSRYRAWGLRLRVIAFINENRTGRRGEMKQLVYEASEKFAVSEAKVRRLWGIRPQEEMSDRR